MQLAVASRRGFALLELLVAVVLLAAVLGAAYQLLVNTQRVSRAQAERVDIQSTMRSGTLILASELRALGFDSAPGTAAVSPDLLDSRPHSVQLRAVRSSGIACAYGANYIVVDTVRNYAAYRLPTPNDGLMIFADRDSASSADDVWVRRAITGVGPATCPSTALGSGHAGLRLDLSSFPAPGATVPDSFAVGAPMRTFEDVTYGLSSSGGKAYLSSRSTSGTAQPVLGPLADDGFSLAYYDSTGAEITGNGLAERSRIRTVRITLVGVSDQHTSSTGYGSNRQTLDSVVTLVALRNAIRR